MTNFFTGETIAIATMHGKENVIQPLVEEHLGTVCIVPPGLNTDQFGTFTREIKRTGTMLDAARAKINHALEITGAEIGIASEGSFGLHPQIPFVCSNIELVVLYDKKRNIEIRGEVTTVETNQAGKRVSSPEEALTTAHQRGFPEHGIVVRRRPQRRRGVYKDCETEQQLHDTVEKILKRPFTSGVFLETDMRAHRNPTRMRAIHEATKNLIKNVKSVCPKCDHPGFMITGTEGSLPCGGCGRKTAIPVYQISICQSCRHTKKQEIEREKPYGDPSQCGYCNP